MDPRVRDVVEECTKSSDDASLTFPQVVMKLMQAGVERYRTDMCRAEKTYYMPNGDSHVVAGAATTVMPAQAFSAAGVEAAVRAVQAQRIDYKEFCERIVAAGCVDYTITLVGRKAIYYGRAGESLVEPFPAAK
jgi:uncharacterized protein YbcV (DUF1398 family)